MIERPLIGLTMRLDLESRRFYLGRDYSEALEYSGAIPIHLGLIPKRDYIRHILKNLNGILLPGSDTDVDPAYYREEPHPKLKNVIAEKDETDFLVLEEAERLNLPILAICYGMQSLNVFRGGSLIQDIESQVANCIKHEQGRPLERNSHHIVVEKHSLLENSLEKAAGRFVKVNSHHHQSVKTIGKNLKVSAKSVDGVVECIEDARAETFVLGIQWHPELSYQTDPFSSNIFKNFVQFCRGEAKS
jgi:putative glutamine amidotransferase